MIGAVLGKLISVIIPTLNESPRIREVLTPLLGRPGVEVIVVDASSPDGTADIARGLGVRVLSTHANRAFQMNEGSRAASGEILVFLHADTRLPDDFASRVRAISERPGVAAGAFRLRIDGPDWGFRVVELFANLRSRILGSPYGDQAIFAKTEVFTKLGRFPEIAIMEDFEFVRRARRVGKIEIASSAAVTSARRWKRLGIVRTTILNWWIVVAYCGGVSPERLRAWYRGRPSTAAQVPAGEAELPTPNSRIAGR